jgi:hypothetical protein
MPLYVSCLVSDSGRTVPWYGTGRGFDSHTRLSQTEKETPSLFAVAFVMPNEEQKNYQDKKLWFERYQMAKEKGDEVGRKRAFNKLIELTEGRFNGKDPNS